MDKYTMGVGATGHSIPANGSNSDHTRLLVHMPHAGRVVSLGTCTKLCAITFTVGVFVGFTLKRRLRRWVAKLLKRMKDD